MDLTATDSLAYLIQALYRRLFPSTGPVDTKKHLQPNSLLYPHVDLLGTAIRKGQPKPGTEEGPALVRNSELLNMLTAIGVTVHDDGDFIPQEVDEEEDTPLFGMRFPRTFINTTLGLAERVESILCRSRELRSAKNAGEDLGKMQPLLLVGGDHSMSAGSLLGHSRVEPNLCVIWVDAHADINTPVTSTTGNMHGMPVAFLVKELQDEVPWVPEFANIGPCLNARDIVYIGLRSLDQHEKYDLENNKITYFTMTDIDRLGIEFVIQQALAAVNPRMDRPIHLSFDIDALDPIHAPSTGTPVPAGLTLREGIRICEQIYSTGKLSVVDLAELNPQLGSNTDVESTQNAAVHILAACFGYQRSGHLPTKVHSLAGDGVISRAEWYAQQLAEKDQPPATTDIDKRVSLTAQQAAL